MTTFPVRESFLQHFWEVALQACPLFGFKVTASWYTNPFYKLSLNKMVWDFTSWERARCHGKHSGTRPLWCNSGSAPALSRSEPHFPFCNAWSRQLEYLISEDPSCFPFLWISLNGFGHQILGVVHGPHVSLLVTPLPLSPCPASRSGDGRWGSFTPFQNCILFFLAPSSTKNTSRG